MKKIVSFYRIVMFSVIVLILGISSNGMAKSLNLYDQPKADGKVISTLDSNSGVIMIFTPKEGGWVKVADPRNGNVGWVKSTELNGVGMHFNVMQTGSGSHGFQVIQYGDTAVTPEQISSMTKQMQLRQQAVQKDMDKMMKDMLHNAHPYWWMSYPMMIPVLVVPEKTLPANTNNQQPAKSVSGKANDKK